MSLTSLLNQKDIKTHFRLSYPKPKMTAKRLLLAPPQTKNYSTVGTAFDYLMRFYLQLLNPNTITKSYWVAEEVIPLLSDTLQAKAKTQIKQAKKHLATYLQTNHLSDDLLKSALLLARLDPIFRSGFGHKHIHHNFSRRRSYSLFWIWKLYWYL